MQRKAKEHTQPEINRQKWKGTQAEPAPGTILYQHVSTKRNPNHSLDQGNAKNLIRSYTLNQNFL